LDEPARPTEPQQTRRAVAAAAVGNATEWYDFGVYSYLAVIIGKVFFPAASPGVQLIASFGTFAAAFLVRPLGGLFFGPLGDRIGRRSVLAVTMVMMAASTFAIGIIPSYDSIGVAAALLLLLARMAQGFSTGGEYGGATTFVAEYAPDRRRGFLASWLEFGTVCGYLGGALLVTLLTLLLGDDTMHAWGWRIPFLVGLPLGAVGLYLRLRLAETPVFVEQQRDAPPGQKAGSIVEIFAHQWRPMLICVGIVLAFNVNNYMLTGYLPSYFEAELGYRETTALMISLGAMVFMLLTVTVVGRVSDVVGRRAVLISGSLCSIVLTVPAFWLLQHGSIAVVVLGTMLLALTLVQFSGTAPATLPALFPTHVRYGALAISFNVSVALFGGTTPLLAEALVETTGNLYAPALPVVVAGLVGVVTATVMQESANRALPGAVRIPEPSR
jgi:MHS family proline/betaine transporter-like MFS transporter